MSRCTHIAAAALLLAASACAPKPDAEAVAEATAARGPDTREASLALMQGGSAVGDVGVDEVIADYPDPPRATERPRAAAPAPSTDDQPEPVALTPGESAPVKPSPTRPRAATRKPSDVASSSRSEGDTPDPAPALKRKPRLRPTKVDDAAAALFGMWSMDPDRSDPAFAAYDRIWLSPLGNCRAWNGESSINGTWTWQEKQGVLIVGVDGLGTEFPSFLWRGGSVELVDSEDRKLVLVPNRLFVKPAPAGKGS